MILKNTINAEKPAEIQQYSEESGMFLSLFNFELPIQKRKVPIKVKDSKRVQDEEVPRLYKLYYESGFYLLPISTKSKLPTNPSKSVFVITSSKILYFWAG
ncbi:MAG: hypothetical protein MHPSP_001136, partial [Paramarteilia canceri]